MPPIARTLGFISLLTLLGASACSEPPAGSKKAPRSTTSESGFVLWEEPRPVPALAFEDGDGRALALDAFRRKVVVLNVWATWCPPCREEMPTLDSLQAKLGGDDLEVLALSIDQAGPKVVREFFDEIAIKHLRLYIDPTAQALNILDIAGIPATLLIDREGRELGRLIGATEWDSPKMLQFLRQVIKETKGENS